MAIYFYLYYNGIYQLQGKGRVCVRLVYVADFMMRNMILRRDCVHHSKYLFDKSRILEKTIEVLDNQNLLSGNLVSI